MIGELTRDRFLGGRVVADQPKLGFRAGHDTVLLAAAIPAQAGEHVLELGSGAGIASLCLATRVSGVFVQGIEIDAELVRLAYANAALNGMAERVSFKQANVDAFSSPGSFDHVFFNPPFHPDSAHVSPNASRDRAKRDVDGAIARWTKVALEAVKPHGTVTAILRADREDQTLAEARNCAAVVFPLLPHAGETPKRIVIQLTKGRAPSLVTAKGLVLHEAGGRNTEAAEAVLRHGAALTLA